MALQRMDNISIVVEDMDATIAFFSELGMELEGRTTVEGEWVDRIVGLENVRSEIAFMRLPVGQTRLELTRFLRPASVAVAPHPAPANARGIGRIMFAVDDIDDTIARLRQHGAELVGEVVRFENQYRLCYLRGPEGVLLALAQQIG